MEESKVSFEAVVVAAAMVATTIGQGDVLVCCGQISSCRVPCDTAVTKKRQMRKLCLYACDNSKRRSQRKDHNCVYDNDEEVARWHQINVCLSRTASRLLPRSPSDQYLHPLDLGEIKKRKDSRDKQRLAASLRQPILAEL